MKWIEVKVFFDFPDTTLATELISNIFYECGVKGVVIENSEIEPIGAPEDAGFLIPEKNAVIGYFPKDSSAQGQCRRLETKLFHMEKKLGIRSKVAYQETAEENWAESWKAFFKPEQITDTLVVKPTWQRYAPMPGEIILEIDPGMAFGTGTHPTTVLCLQMIETLLKPGDTFLDVGCGSGILMIAAAKLGASNMTGIDTDPIAVKVARENLRLNGVDAERYTVQIGHLIGGVTEHFQVVVANILTEVILALLDHLDTVLMKSGIFILSGITEANNPLVLEKMESKGFRLIEIRTRENWVAVSGSFSIRH
jgi:ribosomal protein L11 methyltransferase